MRLTDSTNADWESTSWKALSHWIRNLKRETYRHGPQSWRKCCKAFVRGTTLSYRSTSRFSTL